MLNIRHSFFALYTFLNLTYIAFIAPSYKTAVIWYYLLLIISPFVFNILTLYLRAAYTILNFSESCQGTALKI